MKPLQLIGLSVGLALFVGCESTTHTTSTGVDRQDGKRVAVVQHQQTTTETEEVDEAHRNLWNAQHDILTRDGNAAAHYY
jgi:hypothetical protein